MQRRHLIELHEQAWFPDQWREIFQKSLGFSQTMIGVYENMAEPFSHFLHRTKATSVLDLCSGSAEVLLKLRDGLQAPLNEDQKPKIILSDLYPPTEAFEELKKLHPEAIDYYPGSVNALHPPADAPRVRTMFSALHHFRPKEARVILADAAKNADGIAIFESTARTWSNMLQTVPIPVVAAIITGFMLRPYSFWHLVWGVAVPVIPFAAFFDGMVSNLRTYTLDELREITNSIHEPGFKWEMGSVPIPKTTLKATYLFGWRE